MRKDLVLHLAVGVAAGLYMLMMLLAPTRISVKIAVTGFVLGVAYELLQKFRKEGTPAWDDALTSTAGACLVAVGYEFWIA